MQPEKSASRLPGKAVAAFLFAAIALPSLAVTLELSMRSRPRSADSGDGPQVQLQGPGRAEQETAPKELEKKETEDVALVRIDNPPAKVEKKQEPPAPKEKEDVSRIAEVSVRNTLNITRMAGMPPKQYRDTIRCLAFSPDGKLLASGGGGGTVKLWDVNTGQEKVAIKGHRETVPSVAFSPDGKLLASASSDWTVKLWDVQTGQERAMFQHRDPVQYVAFCADGKQLASASNVMMLWDVETHQSKVLKGVYFTAASADGNMTASISHDGSIGLWDAKKEQWKGRGMKYPGSLYCVAFSPDGKLLASGGMELLANSSGTRSKSMGGTIKLFHLATGGVTGILKGHHGIVVCLAFSPDSTLLASGSRGLGGGPIKLWDVKTGQEMATMNGHTNFVNSVAFSPDGTLLASGSQDTTIQLWDILLSKKADK